MSFARPVRAALDTPGLEEAERDVADARAVLDAVRRRVAAGEDGAAALSTAEYRHFVALRRLDAARENVSPARGFDPPPEGPAAA